MDSNKINLSFSSEFYQDGIISMLLDGLDKIDLQPDDHLYVSKFTSVDNKALRNEKICALHDS